MEDRPLPDLRIQPDSAALAAALAAALVATGRQAVEKRGRFQLVLNGGSTPQGLFELLGSEAVRAQPFWSRTEIYWGDERCVPPDAPGSSYRQAKDAFLRFAPIPEDQVFRVKGELPPTAAAAAYAETLAQRAAPGRSWPRFDLVLLGLGRDGHTASLFPGHMGDASKSVWGVVAQYEDRPANRVTLAPAVFNSARIIYWMAVGEEKEEIVRSVLRGPFDPVQIPAQRIRPSNGHQVWWLDEAAAGGLS